MPELEREGHRSRMRNTYINGGMENAPDHNVLELFLSVIIPRKDVKELSYSLINTFGSLEGVLNAIDYIIKIIKCYEICIFNNISSKQVPAVFKAIFNFIKGFNSAVTVQ